MQFKPIFCPSHWSESFSDPYIHPDLAIDALEMSKKNANATIRDLKKINKVLSRVKDKPCRVEFKRVGAIDDLMLLELLMLRI